MRLSDVFESRYLGAPDLRNDDGSYKNPTVTITNAEVVELENNGKTDRKLAISFKGSKKQLLLNRTNTNSIAELHGDDTDDWIGKAVKLVVARVDFQGKRVDAIRIDPPEKQLREAPGMREQAPPPAPPKGHPAAFEDEEIPF